MKQNQLHIFRGLQGYAFFIFFPFSLASRIAQVNSYVLHASAGHKRAKVQFRAGSIDVKNHVPSNELRISADSGPSSITSIKLDTYRNV